VTIEWVVSFQEGPQVFSGLVGEHSYLGPVGSMAGGDN
jgi:hypothetical protein